MSNGKEQETLWRCRCCGKWSTAKRDPIVHKRFHVHDEEAERWERGWFVWCGPFDRWTATYDDLMPRGTVDLPHLGEPVSPHEREAILAGNVKVPF